MSNSTPQPPEHLTLLIRTAIAVLGGTAPMASALNTLEPGDYFVSLSMEVSSEYVNYNFVRNDETYGSSRFDLNRNMDIWVMRRFNQFVFGELPRQFARRTAAGEVTIDDDAPKVVPFTPYAFSL